jgi:hypothetical protein
MKRERSFGAQYFYYGVGVRKQLLLDFGLRLSVIRRESERYFADFFLGCTQCFIIVQKSSLTHPAGTNLRKQISGSNSGGLCTIVLNEVKQF